MAKTFTLTKKRFVLLDFILDQHSHSIDDIASQLEWSEKETEKHVAEYHKLLKLLGVSE